MVVHPSPSVAASPRAVVAQAYLALGFFWLIQYMRFWRDILTLQNCITAVIALAMVELATWYFDFVNFNSTGFRPYGITIWAVTLGAVRKTVSRMLILVVSMGFGVVRPTLGGLSGKVSPPFQVPVLHAPPTSCQCVMPLNTMCHCSIPVPPCATALWGIV